MRTYLVRWGKLETTYALEKEQAAAEQKAKELTRLKQIEEEKRNDQQYVGISGVFALSFLGFWLYGRKHFRQGTQTLLRFVGLILFFEFIRLPLQPRIELLSGGLPYVKFFYNVLISLIILGIEVALRTKVKINPA